jgi:hypothetical protein
MYEDFSSLANRQAGQSRSIGGVAADLADPFAGERRGYQNQLRSLMENPGSFSSSPVYQFAFDQGLEALNRKAAASGMLNSGNRLAALQDYGQKSVSQMFFPQANLLSRLSGADSGSPAAAGLAFSGAFNRSQDQESMGAAAREYGRGGGGVATGSQRPWYMDPGIFTGGQFGNSLPSAGTGLPSGGYQPSYSQYGGSFSYNPNTDPVVTNALNNYFPSGGQFADNWDLMGDPSAYGLGGGGEQFADNWDLMGDPSYYGLGGEDYSYDSPFSVGA